MVQRKTGNASLVTAIVVIVLAAAAGWWYYTQVLAHNPARHSPPTAATTTAPSQAAVSAVAVGGTAPAPIQHPISEAEVAPAPAFTAPLPPLDASDNAATAAVATLPGMRSLAALLIARGFIPHIVATVDALPRQAIGTSILPVRSPGSSFAVKTVNGQLQIAPSNYARYDVYMKVLESINSRTLVAWYVHWYPLFQQAYRQLGYPHGYFNDRLLKAIDDMLAAPNVQPPVALVETPGGQYVYADPTWESLSVGQKLMIRIGPKHERALKAKLRSIRALLLGETPKLDVTAAPAAPSS